MSLSTVFLLSSQGMTAQRQRLETSASNLANAHSTRSPEGGAYRRRDVLFEAIPTEGSEDGYPVRPATEPGAHGVRARVIESEGDDLIQRFDPSHPDADENGIVYLPNVNPLEETVNMISAARSFEANATVFSTAKEMARTSLKLGEV